MQTAASVFIISTWPGTEARAMDERTAATTTSKSARISGGFPGNDQRDCNARTYAIDSRDVADGVRLSEHLESTKPRMTDTEYKTLIYKLNLLQATVEALVRHSILEHPVPSTDAIPSENAISFAEAQKEILAAIQDQDKMKRNELPPIRLD